MGKVWVGRWSRHITRRSLCSRTHPRAPLKMAGGTTFHFVTDGIHSALKQAKDAAGGQDVRLGGGVSTIRQYLSAGLQD